MVTAPYKRRAIALLLLHCDSLLPWQILALVWHPAGNELTIALATPSGSLL